MTPAAMKSAAAAAANASPNDVCSHIADDIRHGVATHLFFWRSAVSKNTNLSSRRAFAVLTAWTLSNVRSPSETPGCFESVLAQCAVPVTTRTQRNHHRVASSLPAQCVSKTSADSYKHGSSWAEPAGVPPAETTALEPTGPLRSAAPGGVR